MSQIKGKNTIPEKVLFKGLRKAGISFRRHYGTIGNPDVAFPRLKLAIFVDGDFWHGFNYKKRKKTLPAYWVEKIQRNIDRDKRQTKTLQESGWRVIRIWEWELMKKPDVTIDNIIIEIKRLKSNQSA